MMYEIASTTSIDVEKSSSRYKTTLANNRQFFLFKNLKQHLIVKCHKEIQDKTIMNVSVQILYYIHLCFI